MKTSCIPSLNWTIGSDLINDDDNNNNSITIIKLNYLKNIRKDLMEEPNNNVKENVNNEIAYIAVQINGIQTLAMIDTGANVSLIDKMELNRIQAENKNIIPTLPINNITLIGATGRQNKTIRNQVQLEVSSGGETIPMIFLVASGLPFKLLIGCDILRRCAAIIDMNRAKVYLNLNNVKWTAELVENKETHPNREIYYIEENYDNREPPTNGRIYPNKEDVMWMEKLDEIKKFQSNRVDRKLTDKQISKLIKIYNNYRHIFSDTPGKVKNFQCEIKFKENVEFKRKSYPIAFSLKEAVRLEIQRLIEDDIIELSNSPFTNPIVAVPKKNGTVRICLDARELNKTIINDRTLPGEIDEILKKFHGTSILVYGTPYVDIGR